MRKKRLFVAPVSSASWIIFPVAAIDHRSGLSRRTIAIPAFRQTAKDFWQKRSDFDKNYFF
jgi:hypothetical protein